MEIPQLGIPTDSVLPPAPKVGCVQAGARKGAARRDKQGSPQGKGCGPRKAGGERKWMRTPEDRVRT